MTPAGDVGRGALRVLLVVVAILAATSAGCSESDGRHVSARVVRVSDGDTLVARPTTVRFGLKGEEKVRLVGIYCPELAQRWGGPAAARLAALVLGRRVILEVARESRDRYGRLLAGVYLADGTTLVQELIVREGFCRTLVIPPNVDYLEQLRAAKTEAQRAERGIWRRTGGRTEDPAHSRRRHR